MFVPEHYRPADPAWVTQLIRTHALACLITSAQPWPLATHLPIIVDPEQPEPRDERAGLVGTRLLGHLNRANPHWAALRAGQPALLVFQGPNGYVSPSVYQTTPAVPTWDFTSAHLRGELTPIEDAAGTLAVVCQTVAAYERDLGTGWDLTDSLGYVHELLPGVGAFRFTVQAAEGMFKLSQEKEPATRDRVACAFAESLAGGHRTLAEHIRRLG